MDYVQFDILHTLRHLGKLPVDEIAHILGKDRVDVYMVLRDMETDGLTIRHIYNMREQTMIEITIEKLEKLEACQEGIDLFRQHMGEKLVYNRYTLEDQIALIRGPLRKYWGWAIVQRLLPQWSMHDIDLRNADLCGADLRWADLRGANLRWADLHGVNLREANLCGANLRWANLCGANLRWANLRGADLRGANLRWADLHGVNLRWANLHGVNLRWANLYGADLSGANLRRADLSGANLQGAIGIPKGVDNAS